MNIVLIVVGVIVLILLIVLIMYILSKMKGKILIQLDRYDYTPGETITGKLTLKLKKPVSAKALKVGLIGIHKQSRYNKNRSGGYSRTTRSQYAFEFKKPLDGEKEYQPGEKTYDFSIKIPQNLLASSTLEKGAIGTLVKSAQILSGNISQLKWYVIGNLEIAGFDISKRVQVNIG